MSMSMKNLACAVAAAFSLVAGAAAAATITFQFSGTVVYGEPMAVAPGTPIVGTYSYDTDTAPWMKYKGYADYDIPAPHTMSATVGGHIISVGKLSVAVWNDYKGNVEDMVWIEAYPIVVDDTVLPNGALGFALASAPRHNKVLKDTKLPSELDVTKFDAPGFNYGFLQSDGGQQGTLLQFTVDSIDVLQKTR
jgi:hypothetical protein